MALLRPPITSRRRSDDSITSLTSNNSSIRRPWYFFLFLAALSLELPSAQGDLFLRGEEIAYVNKNEVNEASGLVASRKNPDVLWTHNDSGDGKKIYAISKTGGYLGSYRLRVDSNHRDFEDIAIGPGPIPGVSYLYIGDIGNNAPEPRDKIRVFRVQEPDPQAGEGQDLHDVDIITMYYPTNFQIDSEALLVDPILGELVLVRKTAIYQTEVFATPPNTIYNPEPYFSVILENRGYLPGVERVTGGDVFWQGQEILLKTYQRVFYFRRSDPTKSLAHAIVNEEGMTRLPYTTEPQGEAIAFDQTGIGFYTLSETTNRAPTVPLLFYPRVGTLPPGLDAAAATPQPTQKPTLRPVLQPTPPPTLRPVLQPTPPPTLRPTRAPTLPPTQTEEPTVNCPAGYILFQVDIHTDYWGEENSWVLMNDCQNTPVQTGGPYELASPQQYLYHECLSADSQYTFTFVDGYGDGFEAGSGGALVLYAGGRVLAEQAAAVEFSEVRASFGQCTSPTLTPTQSPSTSPSASPSISQTDEPTLEPTTLEPTVEPSIAPSQTQSMEPTDTQEPTARPSTEPTFSSFNEAEPSITPSSQPTVTSSSTPTTSPGPTYSPSEPTWTPTGTPSWSPGDGLTTATGTTSSKPTPSSSSWSTVVFFLSKPPTPAPSSSSVQSDDGDDDSINTIMDNNVNTTAINDEPFLANLEDDNDDTNKPLSSNQTTSPMPSNLRGPTPAPTALPLNDDDSSNGVVSVNRDGSSAQQQEEERPGGVPSDRRRLDDTNNNTTEVDKSDETFYDTVNKEEGQPDTEARPGTATVEEAEVDTLDPELEDLVIEAETEIESETASPTGIETGPTVETEMPTSSATSAASMSPDLGATTESPTAESTSLGTETSETVEPTMGTSRSETAAPTAEESIAATTTESVDETTSELSSKTQVPETQSDVPLAERQVFPLIEIVDTDQNSAPLEQCQGICKSDSDCANGLVCFTRQPGEEVPNCSFPPVNSSSTEDGVVVVLISMKQSPTLLNFCTIADAVIEGTQEPTVTAAEPPSDLLEYATNTSFTLTNNFARFVGNPPSRPLIRCEGDCDSDDDCEDGLICFQREPGQSVIGCSFGGDLIIGGLDISDESDLCIEPPPPTKTPTSAPTAFPTVFPTLSPTTTPPSAAPTTYPTRPPVQAGTVAMEIGNPPRRPLGRCEGDCDDDSDCEDGLICFYRERGQAVYGCEFGEDIGGIDIGNDSDLCVEPPPPTQAPTPAPTTAYPTPGPLPPRDAQYLGNPYEFALERCQGDCDSNNDCADGLFCYERNEGEGAPGCTFGGAMSINDPGDLCVSPRDAFGDGVTMLRLHWKKGYRWQEWRNEQYWCMKKQGAGVQIARCSRGSSRQQFQIIQVPEHGYGKALIKSLNNDECLHGRGNPRWRECNTTDPEQHWIPQNGYWGGVTESFEITKKGLEDLCLTNHHHPRSGEVIGLHDCKDQRIATTNAWEYWF